MNRLNAFIAIALAAGVSGCADTSPTASPKTTAAASGPMLSSYAYPSRSDTSFGRYGYHPLPYDNTGNGPGETGLEGGGG